MNIYKLDTLFLSFSNLKNIFSGKYAALSMEEI